MDHCGAPPERPFTGIWVRMQSLNTIRLLNARPAPFFAPCSRHPVNSFSTPTGMCAHMFLLNLAELRSHFASTIMEISYGASDPEYNKILVQNAEVIVKGLTDGVVPGRYLVNIFPFLRHVPSWFPGARWKRHLQFLAAINRETITRPFEDTRERLVRGTSEAKIGIITVTPAHRRMRERSNTLASPVKRLKIFPRLTTPATTTKRVLRKVLLQLPMSVC